MHEFFWDTTNIHTGASKTYKNYIESIKQKLNNSIIVLEPFTSHEWPSSNFPSEEYCLIIHQDHDIEGNDCQPNKLW